MAATMDNARAEYLAEDNGGTLMQLCIAALVIDTVFIALLYLSRYTSDHKEANLSMVVLMTGSYIVAVCKIVVGILMVEIGGAGRHLSALPPETITAGLKLSISLQLLCPLTTSLAKLSILCLLYKLFSRTLPVYRNLIVATGVLVSIIMIVQLIVPFANCKPFSKSWDMRGAGSCAIPPLAAWRYLSIPNVVTTIIMIVIPLPALYKLQVPLRTKLGLGVVFLVGVAGFIAAVMRFVSFLEVKDFHDITYEEIKPLCWTIVESGIYVMAGVMATLRPLVRKVSGTMRGSGSWGSKWGSKRGSRVVRRESQRLPSLLEKQKYTSDSSSKGTVLGEGDPC